jgi:ATP-dependent DNA helicase RecG
MGIGHEDTKEIDALREALVNLLIHSDYFSPMKPRIRVFTNRIEFENPGKLPRSVEELMKTDETLPRNPVLAKFFRVAKLCESAGFGFDKMLQWKKQTGNEVCFESTVDKTKFTFMRDTVKEIKEDNSTGVIITTQEQHRNNTETTQETTQELHGNNTRTSQQQHKKQHRNNTENLTGNQKKIIANMIANPYITSNELAEIVGITPDNIRVNITKLKKKGIIRREGATKKGKWIIINDVNSTNST